MRSRPATIRNVVPDHVYGHPLVTKLINRAMIDGKKSVSQKQIYAAFEIIKDQTSGDPLSFFVQAMENIRPQMEVRAKRIGGAAYQVPTPVRPVRRDSLAIRWLVNAARDRANAQYHSFGQKLAAEITDAYNNAGAAVKKKLDMHRMAEANKAFAHFRW